MRLDALQFVAGYLWDRLRVNNKKWQRAWTDSGAAEAYEDRLVKDLRANPSALTAAQAAALRHVIRHIVSIPENADQVWKDFAYLRDALDAADITSALLPNVADYHARDARLLEILGLGTHVSAPEPLLELIGGLWHVIRTDTSEHDEQKFNVSLLSIKPLRFVRKRKNGEFEVAITSIPHFSLRSRDVTLNSQQEFRGIVVEVDSIYYFLGNREDNTARLALMAWRGPSASRGIVKPHADSADGIIMTVNADAKPICSPIVAQYIDTNDDMALWNRERLSSIPNMIVPGSPIVFSAADRTEAEFWVDLIEKSSGRAKRYTRDELNNLENYNSVVTIVDLVARLDKGQALGSQGFFRI